MPRDLDQILGLKPDITIDDLEKCVIKTTIWARPTSYESKLILNNGVVIFCSEPIPNWFNRLVLRLLLGWRWEKNG